MPTFYRPKVAHIEEGGPGLLIPIAGLVLIGLALGVLEAAFVAIASAVNVLGEMSMPITIALPAALALVTVGWIAGRRPIITVIRRAPLPAPPRPTLTAEVLGAVPQAQQAAIQAQPPVSATGSHLYALPDRERR